MGVSVESGGGLICSRPFQTTPLRSLLAALSEIEQLLASTFKVRSENSSQMLGKGCVKDHTLQVELPVLLGGGVRRRGHGEGPGLAARVTCLALWLFNLSICVGRVKRMRYAANTASAFRAVRMDG